MNKEKVLVIGASENEARFSNKAIKARTSVLGLFQFSVEKV